jgi:hypothetical protein
MLERINEIFYDFQSFPPNHPIVRSNTVNDAYSIYVFEKLFFPYHRIKKFTRSEDEHRQLLFKSIVPPPDDSIDIFFEVDELDEKSYHIVQVKNTVLRPADIELELNKMEKTISNYLKNAKDIRRNLKEIIAETDFSKQYKLKCHYYLVHEGITKTIRYQKPNHTILNFSELQRIGNELKAKAFLLLK